MLSRQATFKRFRRDLPILALGALVLPFAAVAQPADSPPAASAENRAAPLPAQPGDCGPKAAVYQAGKGPKLWVVRRGTMILTENPLRPLSRDEAVVLDVVVNGRRATAFGPDTDHLRQAGNVKTVEREGREPIRWAEGGAATPTIRVVAEDGRVLLGPMPFGGCDDPPAAKMIADAPEKADPARKGKGRTARAEPDGPPTHLPQGALDGLSLPKSGQQR